ncbi:MAG TPA: EutN/CcmL family microcompartment protein [Candidatus Cybelea sp.]|nr:EutN/CcmL family microcompartment protein [Candidatus Cybelea sp.]
MQLATIVGHATATVKHPSMTGWKLLIAQPLSADGKPDCEPQLVIDNLGAGLDDRVIICNDGAGTRKLMNAKNSPVRWFVMGICDR